MVSNVWALPGYGFVVGLLVGLTGMGGGALMTPVLVLVFGVPPVTAVGTDLAYSAVSKAAGAWQHWKQGTVDTKIVSALAIGSVPATIVAVIVLNLFINIDSGASAHVLERTIGLTLLVAAMLMAYRLFFDRGVAVQSQPRVTIDRRRIAIVGVMGGFLVGLTSIGSGSLILALLVCVARLEPHSLVGTDVAHAALIVGTGALAHLAFGDVDLKIALWLTAGSLPGILIGSRLILHVPLRPLRIALVVLLFATAVSLMY